MVTPPPTYDEAISQITPSPTIPGRLPVIYESIHESDTESEEENDIKFISLPIFTWNDNDGGFKMETIRCHLGKFFFLNKKK